MTLHIDGREVAPKGSLLDAILAAGINLPHLCKDDNLPAIGACRTCLVEADGRIVASCSLPASAVREVSTNSERATRIRRGVLALTAAMQTAVSAPAGPLGHLTRETIAEVGALTPLPSRSRGYIDASNPFFTFDEADCILCGRCVVACQQLQHISAIGLAGRGASTRVTPGAHAPFARSICTSCGSCVAACPTLALSPKSGGLP